ncbi:pantoate--beta-alanine ligase [soil metagenome]
MTVPVVRDIDGLRKIVRGWHGEGLKVAVVPTMGALHEGHLTLVREGRRRAGRVLVTIFVNPRQFAPNEDLARYPRDEEGDLARLALAETSLVFSPPPEIVYPPGFATTVKVGGPASAGLEDKYRPHFFEGVATIVAKLFIQSEADFAMFGEKDYQQLMTVTQMARDLDLPTEIVPVRTVREADGLAMSSRNQYLNRTERQQAPALFRTLIQASEKIRAGEAPTRVTAAARRSLTTLGFNVDYVAARNAKTLAPLESKDESVRLLAAAWLGKTRLIDNVWV